jgi:hypothetical protein
MNTNLQAVAPAAPSVGRDWEPFVDCLSPALATLGEDQNLILSVQHRQRFVQFAGSGASGLRAECVSNAYLAETDQLPADQVAALIAAGWRSPTHAPDASKAEKAPAGSPNFFADFDAPVTFDEVADFAVRTLTQVFEVSHPDKLEYDAFDTEGGARFRSLACVAIEPSGRVRLPRQILPSRRSCSRRSAKSLASVTLSSTRTVTSACRGAAK